MEAELVRLQRERERASGDTRKTGGDCHSSKQTPHQWWTAATTATEKRDMCMCVRTKLAILGSRYLLFSDGEKKHTLMTLPDGRGSIAKPKWVR